MAFPFSFLAEDESPDKGLPSVVLAENQYRIEQDALGQYLYLLRFPDGVFSLRVLQSIRPPQNGKEWILCYESFLFSNAGGLIQELQAALTQLYEWGIYFPTMVECLQSGFTETVARLDITLAQELEPHIMRFLHANDTEDYR